MKSLGKGYVDPCKTPTFVLLWTLTFPEKTPLMKRKKQSKGGEHSPRRKKPKVKLEMRDVSWCEYPPL
jgi:hypothetical protein